MKGTEHKEGACFQERTHLWEPVDVWLNLLINVLHERCIHLDNLLAKNLGLRLAHLVWCAVNVQDSQSLAVSMVDVEQLRVLDRLDEGWFLQRKKQGGGG